MEEITHRCAKAIGQAVKRSRMTHGYSQETFAEICGLDRSYVGQLERGEKNVSLESVLRICRGLDIKPSDLFDEARW